MDSFQFSFEAAIFLLERRLVPAAWKRFFVVLCQLFAPLMNGWVRDAQLAGAPFAMGFPDVWTSRTASSLNARLETFWTFAMMIPFLR